MSQLKYILVPDFGKIPDVKIFDTFDDIIIFWIIQVCNNCNAIMARGGKPTDKDIDHWRMIDPYKEVFRLYDFIDYVKKNAPSLEIGIFYLLEDLRLKKIPRYLINCIRTSNI